MKLASSLLATAMGSRGVAMFLQWVARRPDPSRKRCHAGVLLGAHIHTVALTTVSNCDKFVMVHYTCLVQGTNFCRCHLIRHTSLRWAPFLCIGTGICARFYVVFRFILQRRRRLQFISQDMPTGLCRCPLYQVMPRASDPFSNMRRWKL